MIYGLPWFVYSSAITLALALAFWIDSVRRGRNTRRLLTDFRKENDVIGKSIELVSDDLAAARAQYITPRPALIWFLFRWTTAEWMSEQIARIEALPDDEDE